VRLRSITEAKREMESGYAKRSIIARMKRARHGTNPTYLWTWPYTRQNREKAGRKATADRKAARALRREAERAAGEARRIDALVTEMDAAQERIRQLQAAADDAYNAPTGPGATRAVDAAGEAYFATYRANYHRNPRRLLTGATP